MKFWVKEIRSDHFVAESIEEPTLDLEVPLALVHADDVHRLVVGAFLFWHEGEDRVVFGVARWTKDEIAHVHKRARELAAVHGQR